MEKFQPLLHYIEVNLRVILTENEGYLATWDPASLLATGDSLLRLAQRTYPQLAEVEHRVLHHSIRDAGLGMRMRALEIQGRRMEERDKEYFREVHQALKNICDKIGTGEYYRALLEVRESRLAQPTETRPEKRS